MQLEIVSWNGHLLNDITNYEAYFPFGQPTMPSAKGIWASRTRKWAKLSSKDIDGATLSFHVLCKGTIHSQLEELKAWFPVDDYTFRSLVVKDTADSNRQWYVQGYATEPVTPVGPGEYVITLAIDEPLWRTVTVATDTLAVSATGATKVLTMRGNYPARPVITLTIGTKTGGFNYRLWKPWHNPLTVANNEPLEITGGGWNTAALIADTSKSNQINQGGGISNSTLSIPIDTAVGGGLPSTGGLCYVDSEQILYTSISAGTMTVAAGGRGYGGTTAATHADNAVIKLSQMMANGQDIRVQINRSFVDLWIDGINTATTKIWIVPRFSPRIQMTLNAQILNTATAPFTVALKKTTDNLNALKALPSNFLFYVGTEVFLGASPQPSSYQFRVLARAQKGTSAATHAAGATLRWIEHDIYLLWGNSSAEAQIVDDTIKPMFNLNTSTNTSWDFDEFVSDENGQRSASWFGSITQPMDGESYLYTDASADLADPATVIGFAGKAFLYNGVPKAGNFTFSWELYHPAGFTTASSITGQKRRLSTDWPVLKFQKSATGQDNAWKDVFTESSPGSAGSFGSLTAHTSVGLGAGTWRYIRLYGKGTVKGVLVSGNPNEVDIDFADVTMAINSSNVPQAPFSTSSESNYYLDCTLSIVETGEAISLAGTCKTGSVIVIDCDAETLTVDGAESAIGISWNTVRDAWLDLPSPKQQTTCTVMYEETGVSDVDLDFAWEHRNTL